MESGALLTPRAAVQIDFQFDDALSFGQHLAAVKTGDFWGYVSLSGELVIEPLFLQAKSFSQGSAPVRTADGWQFITLLEYEKGVEPMNYTIQSKSDLSAEPCWW